MARKVFVGMSGGVDSSVTAALLKKQGYDVTGIHLRCYNVDGCAERDAEDARRAAETLDIPFYTFDFEKEYKERVVQYMVEGYRAGITPNPDVECNREIKFGLFLERALKLGADFVATGHYVKLKNGQLFAARDKNKDQSYFLWTLTQKQLARCMFPLGDLTKPRVRKLAEKFNLPNARKKDSQGICFLGQVTLADFLGRYLSRKPGTIVTVAGEKIGEHSGAWQYTIGQRRGIGVGGGEPYYVTAKDTKKNTITVATEGDAALTRREISLKQLSFTGAPVRKRTALWCRVRYRQPLVAATFIPSRAGAKLVFKKPQKFVAEGQSAVLYEKSGKMLGGGIIS